MKISVHRRHHPSGRRLLAISLALGAAAAAAACSSSSSSSSPAAAPSSSAPASSAPASASASAVTISVKSVPGVGNVLVNGQGKTLYMLTSEQGGKITCTASSGCTKVWPETTVATGTKATAGSGVQSALLGTVTGASGSPEVTYNNWPLYTFAGDPGPGVAKGQGLTNFGGTWYVLSAAGNPVTSGTGGGHGY